MKSHQNIGVVLLAAGQSSRMQNIKQLLPWKGTFLLQYVLNRVEELGTTRIVVVLGANASKIKGRLEIDTNRTEIIENPTWKNGLGNSISVGVKQLTKSDSHFAGILICLADQPLVNSVYLQQMLTEFITKEVSIVASGYGDRMGVPAIFGPEIYNELKLLDSDYGAREILNKYKSTIRSLDGHGILADIDTPLAYQKIYNENHDQ